jgi:sulfite exporter TauE/SafE
MLWTALLLGLTSSLHCLGMCGPLVMAVNRIGGKTSLKDTFLYHSGRIIVYAVLGLIVGIVGSGLQFIGIQRWVTLVSGAVMILIYFIPRILGKLERNNWWQQNLRSWYPKIKQYPGPTQFFFGMINGLLPCGMVYMALLGAIIQPRPELSAVYMMIFGAGTLPALVLLTRLSGIRDIQRKVFFRFFTKTAVLIVGCLFVLRGLSLGIPYLSPEITQTEEKTEVNCCSVKNQLEGLKNGKEK